MTIKDIAKESGYALGTVSRVLNNHPDVSDKARNRIMEVVNAHNFVLNENAKQLKKHDTRNIAILVKGTSNILLTSMLEIIQKRIAEVNYTSSVFVLDEYDNEAREAFRIYYERKPNGIMYLGGNPEIYKEDFLKIQVPCSLISNQAHMINNSNISSSSTDDMAAAEFITNYLIKCGHQKIGVIGGDIHNSEITERRYKGFLKAISEAGLDFNYDNLYSTSKYSFAGGANGVEKFLGSNCDITAIFAMSDVMALGAIRTLQDKGYQVPEDISIVGFDGLPISTYYCPRLTTIRQVVYDIAIYGTNDLINCIEKGSKSVHRLIPFEFYDGESVKVLK